MEPKNQPDLLRIHIRRATPADNVLLAEMGAETFYDSFAADNTAEDMAAYLAKSFSPQVQANELANPDSTFLIAENGDISIGYAHLRLDNAPGAVPGGNPAEIARIYARKAWIGKGVGSRLMQACLQEAHQAGCDVVWLGVWERNARAIAFYQRCGFIEVGTQTFLLGSDLQHDLIMAKSIGL